MARHETIHTCTTGRDKGKQFVITEMSAMQGHKWAVRLLLAMLASGALENMDADMVMSRGMAGVAGLVSDVASAIGKIPVEVAEPLMHEMLMCAQSKQEKAVRPWVESDFEEVRTIFELQMEALKLHIAPFITGGQLTSE